MGELTGPGKFADHGEGSVRRLSRPKNSQRTKRWKLRPERPYRTCREPKLADTALIRLLTGIEDEYLERGCRANLRRSRWTEMIRTGQISDETFLMWTKSRSQRSNQVSLVLLAICEGKQR